MRTSKNESLLLASCMLASLSGACSLNPLEPGEVGVTITIPGKGKASEAELAPFELLRSLDSGAMTATPPGSVMGFDCFAVNVYGPGLGLYGGYGSGSGYIDNPACAYMGVVSEMVAVGETASPIHVRVPAGPRRSFQVIGIEPDSGQTCPAGMNFREYIQQNSVPSGPPPYYIAEVGRTTVDLFGDREVEVFNTYTGGGGNNWPFQCREEIPLAAVYYDGTYSETPPTYSDSSPTLPTFASFSGPARNVLINADPTDSVAIAGPMDAGGYRARLEGLFYVRNPDMFHGFQLEVDAVGGSASGGDCAGTGATVAIPPANISGAGYSVGVYKALGFTWHTQSTSGATSMNNSSPNSDYYANYPSGPAAPVTLPAGKYLQVSVRSDTGSVMSINCSALAVRKLKLFGIR